jgi:exopolysaccharide biosynthesis polyprenyl glycosylphosphotransferase
MFSRHRKARVLFGLCDIFLIAAAFQSAYRARELMPLAHEFYLLPPIYALVLGFSAFAWVSIALWCEVYERLEAAHPRIILGDAARQAAYGSLCLIIFQYTLRLELSRPFLLMFSAFAFALLLIFRLTAAKAVGVFRREFARPHQVMVAGTGARAVRLARELEQSSVYGIRLLGFLAVSHDAPHKIDLERAYPVSPKAELPALLRRHVIDEIVFAVPSDSLTDLEEIFLLCDEEGVRTRVAVDFFPHVNSTVSLDRFGSTPLLTFSAAPYDEIRLLVKRVTDILVAASALVVLSPLMAAIAIIVRGTSRGPAIFRQERCGLNGRRFVFYKFRSMCENAEELRNKVAHLNTRDGVVFKIPGDPRLTSVGRYLRKFSIDEWPQLWNVLRGDMSLVGPRPAIPSEVDAYQQWQRRRLRMRPGLTCLWAVSGRDNVDFETWMKMDMQYIDTWSLALDWKIMLRTIPRVLSGHGAN